MRLNLLLALPALCSGERKLTQLQPSFGGWQEEADPASERRSWRWLLEGDTDADGYDHANEAVSLWALLRVSLDRGGPGEEEKSEDIDLEGFGIRIWGDTTGAA